MLTHSTRQNFEPCSTAKLLSDTTLPPLLNPKLIQIKAIFEILESDRDTVQHVRSESSHMI
jgi:hypothetical protein